MGYLPWGSRTTNGVMHLVELDFQLNLYKAMEIKHGINSYYSER